MLPTCFTNRLETAKDRRGELEGKSNEIIQSGTIRGKKVGEITENPTAMGKYGRSNIHVTEISETERE